MLFNICIEHFFASCLFKTDRQLIAFNSFDASVAEFLVEYAFAALIRAVGHIGDNRFGARLYCWRIAWVKTIAIGLRALPARAVISRGGKIIGKPALAGKAIADLFAIPYLDMLGRQFVDKP